MNLKTTRVIISACILSSVTLVFPAYAETLTGTSGGTGGGAFKQSCRSGFVLRGIGAKVGSWVDGVTPVCTVAFGHLKGSTQEDGLGWFGGDGGDNKNTLCSKGEAVLGISATSGMLTGHIRGVTELSFLCGTPAGDSGGSVSGSTPIGGPNKPNSIKAFLKCPRGLVATGIYGRSGKWLDQIGLICNKLSPS